MNFNKAHSKHLWACRWCATHSNLTKDWQNTWKWLRGPHLPAQTVWM